MRPRREPEANEIIGIARNAPSRPEHQPASHEGVGQEMTSRAQNARIGQTLLADAF